ncbi:DNA-binding protein [Streptomyces resistomycificus]|uniref:DNA-binding protein n=1 Tax=Streptomyces resistomycificus TaxID=67356 RepID=A0A0L8L2N9_9ACTN|nr:helix-turn-helix transcriptional regulator [Streptomyces resistomycificus]KOG32508.1 DNA-binding protein [Streptomyces resistomycificus]KUO01843.1 DNA-binding protein [Streptomyces resistomycificus]
MSAPRDDVANFAALLTRLKERTDRSYGSLARRLNMNTSTLHRYCAGEAVPQDFAPVERFAALCGASAEERLELHRLWLPAVAARQRPRGAEPAAAAAGTAHPASTEGERSPASHRPAETESAAPVSPTPVSPTPVSPAPVSAEPEPAPPRPASHAPTVREPAAGTDSAPALSSEDQASAPPAARWFRRRRTLVSAAVAAVLLVTLGSLAALPSAKDRTGDSARPPGTTPRTTAPGNAVRPSPTSPSPSPTVTGSPPAEGTTSKPSPSPGKSRGPSGSHGQGGGTGPSGVPLTWSADSHVWAFGCGHDYVIAKPPAQVPPPPVPQYAATWATTQNAVHGKDTNVRITVQGRTSTAVVLEALRVRVVGRADPAAGTAYSMDHGCGGAVTPRYFDVDLDIDRPIARPVAGSDMGEPIPAMRLPYRVSAQDPEVLLVTAATEGCDCRWYLELDWSSQGRTGTVRVDDHGRPFRTSSIKGLPRYWYGGEGSERGWVERTD